MRDRIIFNKANGFNNIFIKKLTESYRYCKKFRNPPLDFELHVPMPANKQKLALILEDDAMWRSTYGNRFVDIKDTELIEDVKVYPNDMYEFKNYDYFSFKYPFFSTQDDSFADVHSKFLSNMFSVPSRYEISKSVSLMPVA